MRPSAGRRIVLKSLALGLAGLGLTGRARADRDGLMVPGAGRLAEFTRNLAAVPRRRDFRSVPMILTRREDFDAEAIDLVLRAGTEPRQVWNNFDIAGYWTTVMRNALNTQIFGFGHPDFLVVSATHGSAGLALYDQAMWDKYRIGTLLAEKHGDRFRTNTFLTDAPAQSRDIENPTGAFATKTGDSIPVLQQRGVVFMACHNAIWGHAEVLIEHGFNPDRLDQGALAAELTNHLIPGTILTPGIVGTLPELQKAGFFYASI